jgi:hypothetical protein
VDRSVGVDDRAFGHAVGEDLDLCCCWLLLLLLLLLLVLLLLLLLFLGS